MPRLPPHKCSNPAPCAACTFAKLHHLSFLVATQEVVKVADTYLLAHVVDDVGQATVTGEHFWAFFKSLARHHYPSTT